jgi:hypothetical protein
MPASLPLPVRVLVKGSSSVSWVSWMGGPRTDFTFPRAIEEQLLADGHPCEVRCFSMPSEKASSMLRTWQQEVLGFSPDVIVIDYGHFECVHLFLPRWLERHVHSLKVRPRRLSAIYRRLLLRPAWKALAQLQAKLDSVLRMPAIGRRRARQVTAYYERYISQVQKLGSPLVFLFEFPPPNARFRAWFPGMTARIAIMNKAIAELVTRLDMPNVRYFPVLKLIDEHCDGDLEVAIPDGFHYTPELHRLIGATLAREIEEWAETQPHLSGERPPVF